MDDRPCFRKYRDLLAYLLPLLCCLLGLFKRLGCWRTLSAWFTHALTRTSSYSFSLCMNVGIEAGTFCHLNHQFLQDQYRAVRMSLADEQLCLARNDLRRSGLLFLIVMLGSPNRMRRTVLPFFARTANFLFLPGVLFFLLYPENFSPRYVIAISHLEDYGSQGWLLQ